MFKSNLFEEMKKLSKQTKKEKVSNFINKIQQFTEILLWGDKHDELFFEFSLFIYLLY